VGRGGLFFEINRCADYPAIHRTRGVEGDIIIPMFYPESVG
jgi:hypothetical protein